MGRGSVRLELAGLGCIRKNSPELAHHLERQLSDPYLGIPKLRDQGQQPQQLDHRSACQRRRMAQQPSCRSTRSGTRSQVVGVRCQLDHHPSLRKDRACLGRGSPASMGRYPTQKGSLVVLRSIICPTNSKLSHLSAKCVRVDLQDPCCTPFSFHLTLALDERLFDVLLDHLVQR